MRLKPTLISLLFLSCVILFQNCTPTPAFRALVRTSLAKLPFVGARLSSKATPQILGKLVDASDYVTWNPSNKYVYGPSMILWEGQHFVFMCSSGSNYEYDMDKISLTSTVDFVNRSPVLFPVLEAKNGERSACDPSVVRADDGYFYLFYGGIWHDVQGMMFVARATHPSGPYEKWMGNGWGVTGSAAPIARPMNSVPDAAGGMQSWYGAGQPMVVYRDGAFYMWFVDDTATYPDLQKARIYMRASYNGVDWTPATLTNAENGDFKYDPATNLYVNIQEFAPHALIGFKQVRYSVEGITWSAPETICTVESGCLGYSSNNVGIASDEHGWLTSHDITIGYGADWDNIPCDLHAPGNFQNCFGRWDLYTSRFSIEDSIRAYKCSIDAGWCVNPEPTPNPTPNPDPGPTPIPTPSPTRPTISRQPAPLEIIEGQTATFSFEILNNGTTPPYTIEWRRNGVAVPNGNSETLTLYGVSRSGGGSFQAIITNSVGTVASTPVTLTVYYPPRITAEPVGGEIFVPRAGMIALDADADGFPAPTFQWYRDGAPAGGSSTSKSLRVPGAVEAQSGNYSMVASNRAGQATTRGTRVTVYPPPVITSQPPALSIVPEANPIEIKASATGLFMTYQWFKDGAPVSTSISNQTNLNLSPAKRTQTGSYSLVVTNPAGSVTTSAASVRVQYPATLTAEPSGVTVARGQKAQLSMRAVGDPEPTYRWYQVFGGQKRLLPNQSGPDLSFNVDWSDQGEYFCEASNYLGTATTKNVSLDLVSVSRGGTIEISTTGGTVKIQRTGGFVEVDSVGDIGVDH